MNMTRRLSVRVLHSFPPLPIHRPSSHVLALSCSGVVYMNVCMCVCWKTFCSFNLTARQRKRNNNTSRKTWKIVFDLNFVVGFSSFRFLLAVHIKDLSKQTLTKHLFNVFKYVERTQSKIDSSCWARLLLWLPDFFKRERGGEGEWQCVHKYFICLAVV